jgi:putative SOS response-associated peptidase YedK
MRRSVEEVAAHFGVTSPIASNAPEEIYPGYPGLVVHNLDGGRVMRSMTWGFPLKLATMKPGSKPKAVNNVRTDKLDSFMWRYSFAERRCLIPVTEFAEAEGEKGSKTRTWFSLPDHDAFAVAGIWRDTEEWGLAYSMVMTEACVHVAGVHDRMPVILARETWDHWLDGPPDAAQLLCQPYPADMKVRRTSDPWVKR